MNYTIRSWCSYKPTNITGGPHLRGTKYLEDGIYKAVHVFFLGIMRESQCHKPSPSLRAASWHWLYHLTTLEREDFIHLTPLERFHHLFGNVVYSLRYIHSPTMWWEWNHINHPRGVKLIRLKWNDNLVGGSATPLKIWKSIGMIIPNIWENKIDVPNHQPDNDGIGIDDSWLKT